MIPIKLIPPSGLKEKEEVNVREREREREREKREEGGWEVEEEKGELCQQFHPITFYNDHNMLMHNHNYMYVRAHMCILS